MLVFAVTGVSGIVIQLPLVLHGLLVLALPTLQLGYYLPLRRHLVPGL
jgi:hypothetical protein